MVIDKTARKNVFVKVSGDLHDNPAFITWVKELSQDAWVVICVGAGTQISEALENAAIESSFGDLGREIPDFRGRQIARDVLEQNQVRLQDALAVAGAQVTVEMPVLTFGTVLCHVNGDQMVQTVYNGFNEIYVVTLMERLSSKKEQFNHLKKVMVVSF